MDWNKDFIEKNSTNLKLKKINLKIENFTKKINRDTLSIKNIIYFRSAEIETGIIKNKNFIEIKSDENSKIKNNKINYSGKVDLSPFYLNMNINLENWILRKIFL